jgi:hypothetical protein
MRRGCVRVEPVERTVAEIAIDLEVVAPCRVEADDRQTDEKCGDRESNDRHVPATTHHF